MLGFVEVGVEVGAVVELVGEGVAVDIGLVYVLGLGDVWDGLGRGLKLSFHHDLVVGLFG